MCTIRWMCERCWFTAKDGKGTKHLKPQRSGATTKEKSNPQGDDTEKIKNHFLRGDAEGGQSMQEKQRKLSREYKIFALSDTQAKPRSYTVQQGVPKASILIELIAADGCQSLVSLLYASIPVTK